MKRRRTTPATSKSWMINKLITLLEETETSNKSLAESLGVTNQAVGYWLSGATYPNIYYFDKALDVLGYKLAIVKTDDTSDTQRPHGGQQSTGSTTQATR